MIESAARMSATFRWVAVLQLEVGQVGRRLVLVPARTSSAIIKHSASLDWQPGQKTFQFSRFWLLSARSRQPATGRAFRLRA